MADSAHVIAQGRFSLVGLFFGAALALLGACAGPLDEPTFRRKAEQAYMESNPGWSIHRRTGGTTVFVRGDQLDRVDFAALFARHRESKASGSDFLEGWAEEQRAAARARHQSVLQAEKTMIPILKSGSWVRVQDLGAIGPRHLVEKLKPWRKELAGELFVTLGVPEAKLGYRFATVGELEEAKRDGSALLEQAIANLAAQVDTSTGAAEHRAADGKLRVLDLPNVDGVSALILSPAFRRSMLERFEATELGAAVPVRNVLILFDLSDPVFIKPVRARTHQLYETQNHPGFRGLLRLDAHGVSVLEPDRPAKPKAE
jgi:hypothetical protein